MRERAVTLRGGQHYIERPLGARDHLFRSKWGIVRTDAHQQAAEVAETQRRPFNGVRLPPESGRTLIAAWPLFAQLASHHRSAFVSSSMTIGGPSGDQGETLCMIPPKRLEAR